MSPSDSPRFGTDAAPVPETARVLVSRSARVTYHVESARGGALCGCRAELDTDTLSAARDDGRRPCAWCRRSLEQSRRRYVDVSAELHRVAAVHDRPRARVLYSPTTAVVGPDCYHAERSGRVPLCNSSGCEGAEYDRVNRLFVEADGARMCETCRKKLDERDRPHASLAVSGGA